MSGGVVPGSDSGNLAVLDRDPEHGPEHHLGHSLLTVAAVIAALKSFNRIIVGAVLSIA